MALVLVKYGPGHPAEKTKILCTKAEDTLVLIQNGIFWSSRPEIEAVPAKTVVLKEDFISRGYPAEKSKLPLIDYPELVDLIEKDANFIG